ncbi:YybH family protein [Runella sp.]|uniref:YybH family protein n=1 Tax=Runella sp. TaxID=1960881 RepID=UPI003D1497B1
MLKYLLFFSLATISVVAQSTPQQEINEQIWKRFVEAYGNQDTEAFMKIHSEKLVRNPIGYEVVRFEKYKEQNEQNFQRQKKAGVKIKIDFTFAFRTVTGSVAYEIGYYKVTSLKDGKTDYYYGMFNVILQKESGTWKILSDADTGENINEAKFNSGKNWEYVFN